jgi:predicted small integral membrane protein
MFNEIVTIIGLACVGVLWINAEPMIRLRESIYRKIYGCKGWGDKWHYRLLSCCLCSSFWIGLLVTTNILYAAIISVLAELICRKLNSGGI